MEADGYSALQRLTVCRKRDRGECPDIKSGGWLKGKRVRLCGEFTLYRRETVVNKLKQEGAHVVLHTHRADYDACVMGSVCSHAEPPCVREKEIGDPQVWIRRFQLTQPWHMLQQPTCVERLSGHRREIAEVTSWIKGWKTGSAPAALFVYGSIGCGKKTLVTTLLHSCGFLCIKDVCAILDATTAQPALDCISAVCNSLQRLNPHPLIPGSGNLNSTALLVHNANSLDSATSSLSKRQDLAALKTIVSARRVPVIFIDTDIDKKTKFWTKLGSFCRQLSFHSLRPRDIAAILYGVRDALSVCSMSDTVLSSLARESRGDVCYALNVLEHMSRGTSQLSSFGKDLCVSSPSDIALCLTTPQHALRQLCNPADAEHILYASAAKYVKGDGMCEKLDRLAQMYDVFSDCDGLYPGSAERKELVRLAAVQCLCPVTHPCYTPKRRNSHADAVEIGRRLATGTGNHHYVTSASSLSMQLLSAFPDLLKQGKPEDWTVPPSALDTFSMKPA